MSALIEVRDASARYASGAVALDGVSLEVGAGERVALIGANGAGKTTLTHLITGSLGVHRGRLTADSVWLDGRDIRRLSPGALMRAGISQVPEGRGMFATLSVEDNIRLAMAALPRRRRPSLNSILTMYPELADRRRTLAGLLSGGQQQMVAIMRALVTSPRLLVADELSLGLAPLTTKQLVEGLRQRSIEQGMAVLLVEQSATTALKFSERCYVLENGKIVVSAPSAEMMRAGTAHSVYMGADPVEIQASVDD